MSTSNRGSPLADAIAQQLQRLCDEGESDFVETLATAVVRRMVSAEYVQMLADDIARRIMSEDAETSEPADELQDIAKLADAIANAIATNINSNNADGIPTEDADLRDLEKDRT